MNRRGFLGLMGGAIALSAGGIALLEPEPIKTYFLPPRGGWHPWERDFVVLGDILTFVDSPPKSMFVVLNDATLDLLAYGTSSVKLEFERAGVKVIRQSPLDFVDLDQVAPARPGEITWIESDLSPLERPSRDWFTLKP